jgi:ABC-type transporter Mla subunit MlaD
MLAYSVQSYCKEVRDVILPKYNEDKRNMYLRTRDSSTMENALQALSLTANDEQKLLVQGLVESFEKTKSEVDKAVQAAEESKTLIVDTKDAIRRALEALSDLYATVEFESNDSHEERMKLSSSITPITRLFSDQKVVSLRDVVVQKEEAISPYDAEGPASTPLMESEPAPF